MLQHLPPAVLSGKLHVATEGLLYRQQLNLFPMQAWARRQLQEAEAKSRLDDTKAAGYVLGCGSAVLLSLHCWL